MSKVQSQGEDEARHHNHRWTQLSLLALIELLAMALWTGRSEPAIFGFSSLQLAAVLMVVGPVIYLVSRVPRGAKLGAA